MSREKVPIGNLPDVFVALEEPYTLLKVDDFSCRRGKSDPNLELEVERLLKLLNACDFPKNKGNRFVNVLCRLEYVKHTVTTHCLKINDGRILSYGVGRLEVFPLRIGGHSLYQEQ